MKKCIKIFLTIIFDLLYFVIYIPIFILNLLLLPFYRIKTKNNKLLYFSLIEWKWIKQRPQFISERLVDYNYYVDYCYLTRTKRKKETINNDMRIIPLFYRNGLSRIIKIKSLFKSFISIYNTIIITHPNQSYYYPLFLYKIRGTQIIYECMDNYEYWEENKKRFEQNEKIIVKLCNSIIVSSISLKKIFIEKYNEDKKVYVIKNGYDKSTFNDYEKTPIKLKHPSVVYIGTIDSWLDIDSIIYCAKKDNNIYYYLIGPIQEIVLNKIVETKLDNIKYIKPIEHKYIPDTIANSDIMLIPFIINDLIKYVDPVKMYEYLYMKKEVISSYWDELEQFKKYINIYNNKEKMFEIIKKLVNNNKKITKETDELFLKSSWDDRIKDYIKIIRSE